MGSLSIVAALLFGLAGCNNECDFFERCNGNTREVCGDGPDQAFGRKVRSFPCEAPNDVCVAMDDHLAVCVLPPKTSCDESFTSACEGTMRTFCPPNPYTEAQSYPTRFVTGEECAGDGGTCSVVSGSAVCE